MDRCGGCPAIGLPYGDQLTMKHGRVAQSVVRYPSLGHVILEPVASADPIVGYRARAKLIVAPGAKVGLFARGGGHHVVDVPNCRVLSKTLATVVARVREMIANDEASGGPFAPFATHGSDWKRGSLRAIDLREVHGDESPPRVLATLIVQREAITDLGELERSAKALIERVPEVIGVALNFHEGDAPQILGAETVVVGGVSSAVDHIGQTRHLATYGSFVQAHRGQAERIHATLIDLFDLRGKSAKKPRLLDLYGGSGAIALALAQAGAEVEMIESFAPAAAQAEQAARQAELPVFAEASDVALALRRHVERGAHFDGAVINPPRRGMSPLARDLLARLAPSAVAYVSCDPDTLARDLDHFSRLGFAVTHLRPFDMIPLTDEVETIAWLRRGDLPLPNVVYDDEEILIVEKSAHEPISGEHGRSLVERARVLPGAGQAVVVHRLDVGTSGLVMLVKDPKDLARWQAVIHHELARVIFVVGARGIVPAKGAITRDLREDGELQHARTRFRRLGVASGHSVLRVIPEEGFTHQIRRHFAAWGHPVLGDDRYGHPPTNRFFEEKNGLDRTFLHCVRIEFDHPVKRQRMIIEATLPGDLRTVLERTSGAGTLRFLDHKNALGRSGSSSIPPSPLSI